jgi:hypothetical protein
LERITVLFLAMLPPPSQPFSMSAPSVMPWFCAK